MRARQNRGFGDKMASLGERESSFCDKNLPNTISRLLYEQKENAVFCDIIMRICGTEMAAHSAVLAAASPYFSTFLSQDLPRHFSQRSPQIIEIQIDGTTSDVMYAEAVTAVIDFIYTGTISLKTSTVVQVSELARIMKLDAVNQFCQEFVLNSNKTPSEPSGAKMDIGVNTESDPFTISEEESGVKILTAGTGLFSVAQHKSKTSELIPLGHRSLYQLHPSSTSCPQKLFRAGRLVSTSTQVTPALLGILPPKPKETKECKTQTLDKDFPEKMKPHYLRSGKRKHQQSVAAEENNDIVMEITRNKTKTTSVRVVKQDLAGEDTPEPGESLRVEFDEDGRMHITERNDREQEMAVDAENEELCDKFGDDASKRRSGRRPKPTPKILALRRRGAPLQVKQLSVAEEVQPSETATEPKPEEAHRKSPRKTKHVPREESIPENIPEEEEVEKQESEKPPVEEEVPEEKVPEEKIPEEKDAEESKIPEEPKVNRMLHIARSQSRKKPLLRRRRRQLLKFACSECSFQTNKVREFSSHKRLHKMENNICYYCEEKFDTKDELTDHFDKHKGPLPYFCPVCDCRYKSKTQLNIHLPKHSTDKPFVCEDCGAGFKWKHALKNHMVVHSNRKDHLCDECGYATAHKCQLKAHKLIHTGQTFRCPFSECRFQATKRQNLKYHLLTHTREKPHQCEICGQSFSLIKNMRRHMLLHSTDKPHHCDQCDFSTTRFDKLKEHMLKMHGMGSPPEKRVRVADLVDQNFVIPGEEIDPDDPDIVPEEEEIVPVGEIVPAEVPTFVPHNPKPQEPTIVKILEEDELEPGEIQEDPVLPLTTDNFVRAAGGLIGGAQTMQFIPGQTIIITQTNQDGEVQTHEVTMPAQAGILGPDAYRQIPNTVQFAEVMIPASQLSEYVQELALITPT